MGRVVVGVFAAAALMSGCGGGSGSSETIPMTLTEIQNNIFSPRCGAACHNPNGSGYIGTNFSTPPRPLDLSSKDASYAALVGSSGIGVDSTIGAFCGATLTEHGDQPCGVRVKPGDPDHSWLVVKIEGTNPVGTGDEMPQFADDLSFTEIAMIRQWIAEGAKNN